MDRLTAEDQRMLWPDEIWPHDIGALAILDGSHLLEAGGGFRIEAVQEGHRPRRARRVTATLNAGTATDSTSSVRRQSSAPGQ